MDPSGLDRVGVRDLDITLEILNGLIGLGDGASLGITKIFRTSDDPVDIHSSGYRAGKAVGNATIGALIGAGACWLVDVYSHGREFEINDDFRIAPLGNRKGHKTGKYPHYHRRYYDDKGNVVKGQGGKRHRPWDKRATDKSIRDRF